MMISRLVVTARWAMFIAAIVGADLAALNWVVTARSCMYGGIGGGPTTYHWRTYEMYDGSRGTVFQNLVTGKTIRRTVRRPATPSGLCRVWWPAVAGGFLTPLAVVVARTRPGRWFIAESHLLPLMTTRRWLAAVAVMATEGGLVISTLRSSGVDPSYAVWPPILLGLVLLHALAFVPVGVVLLYRLITGPRPWDDEETVMSAGNGG